MIGSFGAWVSDVTNTYLVLVVPLGIGVVSIVDTVVVSVVVIVLMT